MTARQALLGKEAVGEGDGDVLDDDVRKLKEKIAANLVLQQDLITPRRFIMQSTTNPYLNQFEYLVMTLAIWNAIWTPLTIAFEHARVMDGYISFTLINEFVNFVFWVDIFLQFLSSYVDAASGTEIFAPKKIAVNYMV